MSERLPDVSSRRRTPKFSRRIFQYFVGALLLALSASGAALSAPGIPPGTPELQPIDVSLDHRCPAGLQQLGERLNGVLCSHGADSAATLGLQPEAPASATFWPDDRSVRPTKDVCVADGKKGHRIHFFYAYRKGSPNQMKQYGWRNEFRKKIGYADAYLDESDSKKDQHLRVLCAGDKPVITPIAVSRSSGSVYRQVVNELQARGYDGDEDDNRIPDFNEGNGRIYAAFIDGFAYDYCGQGSVGGDDSKDPMANRAPEYSIMSCWYGGTILHEVGHNLGAVQPSAPHGSSTGHCTDENDRMCYLEAGSPRYAEPECPRAKEWSFDCGHNKDGHRHNDSVVGSEDYWDPRNPMHYLAKHWNTADSVFLTEVRDD